MAPLPAAGGAPPERPSSGIEAPAKRRTSLQEVKVKERKSNIDISALLKKVRIALVEVLQGGEVVLMQKANRFSGEELARTLPVKAVHGLFDDIKHDPHDVSPQLQALPRQCYGSATVALARGAWS